MGPPSQPRPQCGVRRINNDKLRNQHTTISRCSGASVAPPDYPSSRGPETRTPRALRTPRSLPPLPSKAHEAESNSRCSTAASSIGIASPSNESNEYPFVDDEPQGVEAATHSHTEQYGGAITKGSARQAQSHDLNAESTDAHARSSLNRRKQVTAGGRSFFSWSFRNKKGASKKYEAL